MAGQFLYHPVSATEYLEDQRDLSFRRVQVPAQIEVTRELIKSLVPRPSPRPVTLPPATPEVFEALPLETDLATLQSVREAASGATKVMASANFQRRTPASKEPVRSPKRSPLPIISGSPKPLQPVLVESAKLYARKGEDRYTLEELRQLADSLNLKSAGLSQSELINLLKPYSV